MRELTKIIQIFEEAIRITKTNTEIKIKTKDNQIIQVKAHNMILVFHLLLQEINIRNIHEIIISKETNKINTTIKRIKDSNIFTNKIKTVKTIDNFIISKIKPKEKIDLRIKILEESLVNSINSINKLSNTMDKIQEISQKNTQKKGLTKININTKRTTEIIK